MDIYIHGKPDYNLASRYSRKKDVGKDA